MQKLAVGMAIRLILVGKTAEAYVREGMALYTSRIGRYCRFSVVEIPDLKQVSALSPAQIKEKEGVEILKNIHPGDEVILLDERGKSFSSIGWAQHLEQRLAHCQKDLVFVVGGSWGFSQAVYDRGSDMLSLSKMTCSHQLIRLFFLEQLYRAFTIMKGEPYHHE